MKLKLTILASLFALCANAQVLFQIPNTSFAAGDTVKAEFYAFNYTDVEDFQFAMKADASLLGFALPNVVDMNPALNLGWGGFSWHGKPGYALLPGEFRCLFSRPTGQTLEDGTFLFSIAFVANTEGSLANSFQVWQDHPVLKPTAHNGASEVVGLEIAYFDETTSNTATPTHNALSVAVSPNPVLEAANVFVRLDTPETILINVVDSAGYNVFGRRYEHSGGVESFAIDIPASGIYFVAVSAGQVIETKKIVKN